MPKWGCLCDNRFKVKFEQEKLAGFIDMRNKS
jgi:hypothetical protein